MVNESPSPEDKPCDFSQVHKPELEDLKKRREKVLGAPPWESAELPAQPEGERLRQLRREALDNDLVGLALSGGGIRSATFCLGVIQALAELGFLRKVDYLSTVSGGGYIGSWLAAWIKREGNVENVEKQLQPDHVKQAEAQRWRDPGQPPDRLPPVPGQVLDDEPEPIRHLRAYSNYLAPRPGLFSADGWCLIAVYLRNLLLNQTVLLLTVLALLFSMAIVVQLFAVTAYVADIDRWQQQADNEMFAASAASLTGNAPATAILFYTAFDSLDSRGAEAYRHKGYPLLYGDQETQHVRPRNLAVEFLLAGTALILLAWACLHIHRVLGRMQAGTAIDGSARTARRRLHTRILIPLLMAAVLASLFSMYFLGPKETDIDWVHIACLMAFFGIFHALFGWKSWLQLLFGRQPVNPRLLFSGLFAGALGGLLMYLSVIGLQHATENSAAWVPLCAALMPPLLLVVFVLTGFVQIGAVGNLMDEAHREWWSSLGGWILMYAGAWLALFGVAIFGPWLLLHGAEGPLQSWTSIGAALTWVVSVAGGLVTAHSPDTGVQREGASTKRRIQGLVARVAPAIFLLGLFVLLAMLPTVFQAVWLDKKFPNSTRYFGSLNSAIGPATLLTLPGGPGKAWAWKLGAFFAVAASSWLLAHRLGRFVDVNIFSMENVYANRLIRCYLGASRRKPAADGDRPPGAAMNSHGPVRAPDPITGFDPKDDLALAQLQTPQEISRSSAITQPTDPRQDDLERDYWGPLPIINTALNLVQGEELAWQERKAESFALTPRYCGSQTTGYRLTNEYAGGIRLGMAMSISGAALSPNMGYHSAPAVTAMLTVFNARLGAWLGNPRSRNGSWRHPGPQFGLFLLREMLSRTDAHSDYVYLSDGGHFDNLGVYELIRRRCRYIIVCDAGADPDLSLFDLGALVRKVRIDFGVRIDLDVSGLRRQSSTGRSCTHIAVGKIRYGDVDRPREKSVSQPDDSVFLPENDEGMLVYLKPTLTGDEPTDVDNYAAEYPEFPHQSTLNQFFTESQFESYRALGCHAAMTSFSGFANGGSQVTAELFRQLYERWYPPPPNFTQEYLQANRDYVVVQEALRDKELLRHFSEELYPESGEDRAEAHVRSAQRHMVAQMLTVLENAWFGLDLKRYRGHRIHTGWLQVCERWLSSTTFQHNWKELRGEFSQEFQEFIDDMLRRLGER